MIVPKNFEENQKFKKKKSVVDFKLLLGMSFYMNHFTVDSLSGTPILIPKDKEIWKGIMKMS